MSGEVVGGGELALRHIAIGPAFEEVGGEAPGPVVGAGGGVPTVPVTTYTIFLYVSITIIAMRVGPVAVPIVTVVAVASSLGPVASVLLPQLRVTVLVPFTGGHATVVPSPVGVRSIAPRTIRITIRVPAVVVIPDSGPGVAVHCVGRGCPPVLTNHALGGLGPVSRVLKPHFHIAHDIGNNWSDRVEGSRTEVSYPGILVAVCNITSNSAGVQSNLPSAVPCRAEDIPVSPRDLEGVYLAPKVRGQAVSSIVSGRSSPRIAFTGVELNLRSLAVTQRRGPASVGDTVLRTPDTSRLPF